MHDPAIVDRVEVNGRAIRAIISAFGSFTMLASQYLISEGLGEPRPDGSVLVDEDGWYPLRSWLNVLQKVERDFGARFLRQTGEAIMKSVKLPPGVNDMHSALATQNAGYHLGHRLDGRPMFDPATKKLTPGIGDYAVTFVPQQNLALLKVDTPAPCAMNEGSVLGLARQFDGDAYVAHEPGPCRAKGAEWCVYRVTWPAG